MSGCPRPPSTTATEEISGPIPSPSPSPPQAKAAAPEEFASFFAGPEPFSPSPFLDLPPTPTRPDAGGDGDPASSDDLVPPFISRMLLEEDIDDKFFYQSPDHPALLAASAQQPYAQILSGDSAANNSGNTFSPSSSSEAPASADPVWPYDAVELSQLLRSPPCSAGDIRVGLDDFAAGFHQRPAASCDVESAASAQNSGDGAAIQSQAAPILPGADGDHGALASAPFGGAGQSGVNMEMLNLAFLKGMEEANKFLPTTISLTSGDAAGKRATGFAAGKLKKEDKTPMFGGGSSNGRGRKNRRYEDDLEAEAGRNSKVMLPDQEESGVGEMFQEATCCSYEEIMKRMQDLRIAMDSESEKNIRIVNEVVDLHTMLIHCAQAVSTGDRRNATELLKQIKQHTSPRGDSTQRLAHCFAEGLEARLAGTGSQLYQSLVSGRTSVVEFLKAYKLFSAASCIQRVQFVFSNMTIRNAVAGRTKLHIVDYGIQYGLQWPDLLHILAQRDGGPPEVRLTAIDFPQPGFRPAYQIKETGRRLSNCAHQFGVPFKFHAIAAKWETVRAEDLHIDPDEVLVVNGDCHFANLKDDGVDVDSPSPRDMALNNIVKMRPAVFIQNVMNGTFGAPFFVTRFREALFFYSAFFDMLDATIPRDKDERLLIERDIFGRAALNVIACEGVDRVDRPETYKQCQTRNNRAGLSQLPLNPEVVKFVRDKVKSYHKDFVIDQDHRWLLYGWKGRVLYAISTWVAEENV